MLRAGLRSQVEARRSRPRPEGGWSARKDVPQPAGAERKPPGTLVSVADVFPQEEVENKSKEMLDPES